MSTDKQESSIKYNDGTSVSEFESSEKKEGIVVKDSVVDSEKQGAHTSDDDTSDEARKLAGDVRTIYTEEEQNAVRRKLDMRLLPLLSIVYLSQFLDKSTLNYSSILGLPITGSQYSLSALAFYLGFLIFELPTNYVAQKFPLAKYLGFNIVLWAIVLTLHAVTPQFGPFFTLRFLLGVFECCVTPILIKLIAAFYKTDEQPLRIGTFYLMNGIAIATGGLVGYGSTFYEGTVLAPWKLLFIVFGCAAFGVGIIILLFLPDSPATASFLTPRERLIAIERVRDNKTGTVNKTWRMGQAKEALLDVRTWLIVLASLLLSTPNGGFSNYSNLIIKALGFTTRQTLLLSVPQGAIASITTISVSYWAQRAKSRTMPIFGALLPTILGAAMLIGFTSTSKSGALVGIFLTSCYGSSLSILYSYSSSNVAGSSKKTVTNALLMAAFALGNIIGTQIFPTKDGPAYLPGKIAVIVLFLALGAVVLTMRWVNIRMNKNKAIALAKLVEENGWSEEDVARECDKMAFLDLTDKENPFFVYLA